MVERKIKISKEKWPLKREFSISRGSKILAEVVVVEIYDGQHVGRGECVPYARYGENVNSVVTSIESCSKAIETGCDRFEINKTMEPGAARNAIDNGLWDLEAKLSGRRIWDVAGVQEPEPAITAETIGIGSIEKMALDAQRLKESPLIKVKLNNEKVLERITAVRLNAPKSRIIVDANEGWSFSDLSRLAPKLKELNVAMIEQPLPASRDNSLESYSSPIPLCADESCHMTEDLPPILKKYQMINIKLDKTGGLTEALRLAKQAKKIGMGIMIGCMIGTSLAMAPATLLMKLADFVDLDGPLLLKKDRSDGLIYREGRVFPPKKDLWG